jgi:hypothetical protein
MSPEMPDHSPHITSLRWLNLTLKSLGWLTVFFTVGIVIIYVGQQLFNDSYKPSFANMLVTVCVMLACGGICAFFFMALGKLTEIWAEIGSTGHHKTTLLGILMTDPIEQKGE